MPLRPTKQVRCGACRLWTGNLTSYTNAMPVPRSREACPGISRRETVDG